MGTTISINLALLAVLLIFTVLWERLTEQTLKIFPFLDHRQVLGIPSPLLVALFWSVLLACAGQLNFFAIFGLPFGWPWLGVVVTAILMTGGSAGVHEIIKRTLQEAAIAADPSSLLEVVTQVTPEMQTGSEQSVSGVPPSESSG